MVPPSIRHSFVWVAFDRLVAWISIRNKPGGTKNGDRIVKRQCWTLRCVLGVLFSLAIGVIATCAAYLQEDRFQHINSGNPWLMGIVINSVLAAVFVLPISAVIGRVVQRTFDRRQAHPASQEAGKADSID